MNEFLFYWIQILYLGEISKWILGWIVTLIELLSLHANIFFKIVSPFWVYCIHRSLKFGKIPFFGLFVIRPHMHFKSANPPPIILEITNLCVGIVDSLVLFVNKSQGPKLHNILFSYDLNAKWLYYTLYYQCRLRLKLHKSDCALRVEKDYKFCAVSEIMK